MKIKIKFVIQDMWIGLYWVKEFAVLGARGMFKLYICIIPMFPIIISIPITRIPPDPDDVFSWR